MVDSGMMSPARVAIAQLRSTNDKLSNLAAVSVCARLAAEGGASFLCLPECFAFIGSSASETAENAEDVFPNRAPDGVPRTGIVDALRHLAVENGLWISAGGFHERTPADDSMVFNTHILLRPDGILAGIYRKCHLFDVSIPRHGVELRESASTAPGLAGTVIVRDTPLGNVGLTTCYDLRFPEVYAALSAAGADAVLVPSAFTVPTGVAHWHLLLRARAVENQCYVLAAAQVGMHGPVRKSYGHALAVDPWGLVTADAGGYDGERKGGGDDRKDPVPTPAVVFCDVDKKVIESTRERMPIARHRAACPAKFGEVTDGLEEGDDVEG